MTPKIKLVSYAVLIILVAWFAWGFHSAYSAVSRESAEPPPPDTQTQTPVNSTNAVAGSTNDSQTPKPTATAPAPAPVHSAHGRMIGYLAALVGALIGLGILVAYDVTQVVSSVAIDALLDDRGEGMRDPEYERAEQTWAAGKHLEAIQIMREFLRKNPREQYAALRIAEIYEKDLNNLLAAALEYEEVLKRKLPAERWGWAAIHLCNLYSKLGQQDKTRALLQRIVDDYPKTGAAKKARNRLGIAEPEPEPKPKEEAAAEDAERPDDLTPPTAEELEAAEAPPAPPPPPPPAPKSNLPPGFRPKS
jgi:TolA-binding protein